MGSEGTGYSCFDRFRKSTKLSIITDDLEVPLSIHLQKGHVHDVKLVLSNMKINIGRRQEYNSSMIFEKYPAWVGRRQEYNKIFNSW